MILVLDAYNLIHRARWSPMGKAYSGNGMTFSFFRSLKALVEKFDPDKVYLVLEGHPKLRHEATSDYKGTRGKIEDESFHEQKEDIISLCRSALPITIIRHPEFECDDVIGFLTRQRHVSEKCTIVSTDTDFIQLLTNPNTSLYNPVKKKYINPTPFNYVQWKALRGDSADNIHGFKGIGDKRATKLLENRESLYEFLDSADNREKFAKNCFLISLHDYILTTKIELLEESSSGFDWKGCRKFFQEREFGSMLNTVYSTQFKKVFSNVENK